MTLKVFLVSVSSRWAQNSSGRHQRLRFQQPLPFLLIFIVIGKSKFIFFKTLSHQSQFKFKSVPLCLQVAMALAFVSHSFLFFGFRSNIYFLLLCWVFIAARAFLWVWQAGLLSRCGLLVAVASRCGAHASVAVVPRLQSTGSVVVAHEPSCSGACGIFPDQELNPCLLHWQADSLVLSHQARPSGKFFIKKKKKASTFLGKVSASFNGQVLPVGLTHHK